MKKIGLGLGALTFALVFALATNNANANKIHIADDPTSEEVQCTIPSLELCGYEYSDDGETRFGPVFADRL